MKWFPVILIAAVIGFFAYRAAYPTYSYRYRITIEVDTTSGVKTGSSVLQNTTTVYPGWRTFGTSRDRTTVRGEAVFVDLPGGRNLIALLALGPHAGDGRASLFAPRSYFPFTEGDPRDLEWSMKLSSMHGRRTYAGDMNPTLVSFLDPLNPSSVREVPFHNPGKVLGSDVRSVRAWIELTSDPVTDTLQTKLPWIGKPEAAMIAWRVIRPSLSGSSSPLYIFRMRDD